MSDAGHKEFFQVVEQQMAGPVDAVIVADDDDRVRLLVTLDIKQIDPTLKVYEARNGEEALKAVAQIRRELGKDPSFIVLDLEMPVLDGWDVITHLRDDYERAGKAQGIPVIVLSGHGGDKRLSLFRKKTVHGRAADYYPMITIAKDACTEKDRYHGTGREALLVWLATLAGCDDTREDLP